MKIDIRTIDHKKQRYDTVGDYISFFDDGANRQIAVSKMGNVDYEFLVALHEMIEQHLCLKRGIYEQEITDFDIQFEKDRKEGNVDEPGNDPRAPYWKEHQLATHVEKIMAQELGVDWDVYSQVVDNL